MTDIEKNENVSYASENGALNKEQDKQEKMFTQSKLEEIIAERLSRERKVNESLLAVKSLLKNAADKGLIKGSSYTEMAKDLVDRLKESSAERSVKAAEQASDGAGTNLSEKEDEHSSDADGEEKTDALNECGNDGTQGEKCSADESFTALLSDIKAKYPRNAVEKLFSGDLFERFAKGRSGSMKEIVDDFFSFIDSAGSLDTEKNIPSEYSSFTSTAFSSQSGVPDTGTGLTKQQMEIAKSAGMSYREYQNLLESIPKRTGRTF